MGIWEKSLQRCRVLKVGVIFNEVDILSVTLEPRALVATEICISYTHATYFNFAQYLDPAWLKFQRTLILNVSVVLKAQLFNFNPRKMYNDKLGWGNSHCAAIPCSLCQVYTQLLCHLEIAHSFPCSLFQPINITHVFPSIKFEAPVSLLT